MQEEEDKQRLARAEIRANKLKALEKLTEKNPVLQQALLLQDEQKKNALMLTDKAEEESDSEEEDNGEVHWIIHSIS